MVKDSFEKPPVYMTKFIGFQRKTCLFNQDVNPGCNGISFLILCFFIPVRFNTVIGIYEPGRFIRSDIPFYISAGYFIQIGRSGEAIHLLEAFCCFPVLVFLFFSGFL